MAEYLFPVSEELQHHIKVARSHFYSEADWQGFIRETTKIRTNFRQEDLYDFDPSLQWAYMFAKWALIAESYESEHPEEFILDPGETCSFCWVYIGQQDDEAKWCDDCPVYLLTGRRQCSAASWYPWHKEGMKWMFGDWRPDPVSEWMEHMRKRLSDIWTELNYLYVITHVEEFEDELIHRASIYLTEAYPRGPYAQSSRRAL